MKTAELGDVFYWGGDLVTCEWINDGRKSIGFIIREEVKCPHCGEIHEVEKSMNVIESSPQFQDGALAVPTIKGK